MIKNRGLLTEESEGGQEDERMRKDEEGRGGRGGRMRKDEEG